ncbi:MAG: carbohydrate ABC transporter permease [Christensenellaceae bacterium]|nr:carbohydrate ABC transporter permease [Christensenellaceae bacterium]MEA5064548.1 carbohydrate ABC transporter permease [Eubacteriales bacterium]MEA5070027.1 carbohydrate ABC transporter permease [Christensenellaceae bacterium]
MKERSNAAAVVLRWMFLAFITLISVGPLVWIVMSSFKTNQEILQSAFALPSRIGLDGYAAALSMSPIFRYYGNSLLIAGLSTALGVLVVAMAAYVIVRVPFRGSKALMMLFSSSLLVPVAALLMPIYIILTRIGLYDTKAGLTIVYAALGLPTSLFILRAHFQGVPKELEEAAFVDGGGFLRIFFSIVLPVVKPGLAAAAVMQFLTSWNEFMFALILTKSNDNRTIPLALSYFTSQFTFNYTAMFAALVMVVLPSILIYVLLQEQITDSLVAGSVKG